MTTTEIPDGAAVYEINLGWGKPPLNMNDRHHWARKARLVAEVRETAGWAVRAANIGRHQRVKIELHYQPRTVRGRDSDNLAATYKPCVDACVDAGVIPDDTDEFVSRDWPTIHPAAASGRVWLVVTVLA